MGRAQKLKQQRKEEQVKKQQEEKKEVARKVIIALASVLTIALTVFLILLVDEMKKRESEKPQETQEETSDNFQQQLEAAKALDAGVPTVPDEIGVPNLRGGVGMAKPSDPATQKPVPDSGQNEFYILKADASYLDPDFTIFGQVVEGMEVVDSLTTADSLLTAEIREVEGEKPAKEWVLNTSAGTIVVRLLTDEAPLTTQHIVDLTDQGFFNDLKWYRVEDFVVQTGSHERSLSEASAGIPLEGIPVGEETPAGGQ